MGVGRRMRKQGPPEPLSEEHFAKLKRKAGLPVDPPTAAPSVKKRKTSGKLGPAQSPSTKRPGPKRDRLAKSVSALAKNGIRASLTKTELQEAASESTEELDDGLGSSELDEEGLSDLDTDGGAELADDFLGSDDSVYDSDAGPAQEEFVFSEDEGESDAEEKLTAANIEGLSKKLDRQLEQEAADAQAELEETALQTNIDGDEPIVLDDGEDGGDMASKTKSLLAPDLQLLRSRITDIVRVLDDFKLGDGRSRAEYTAQVLKDICAYYGYSEYMAEKLFNLFPPREAVAFFEANESPRPMVIRTNTLRTSRRDLAQALINRGVVLEPVGKWSKVGLQIFESGVPIGATPEYLAGHYILQAASSFLPVMALCPQEHERVLDMAAAPGGKTTHMAQLMKNTGCIFANDYNKARTSGLIANVHRLGARNVVVCNYDAARAFPKIIGGFDRVLLDAPCSGTGVISKDPSIKTNRDERDFIVLPEKQKKLLLAAIDSVNQSSKTGGYLVYSTCSVTVEENEQVVAYALSRRPNVRLVETGLPFGKEGFTSYMGKKFPASMRLARRYYPHAHNFDGFFVAKFQKTGPTAANAVRADISAGAAAGSKEQAGEEVIDKTPISPDAEARDSEKDDFGGFDDKEDERYIEKARRNAMRRRGIDPRAMNKKGQRNGTGRKD